MSFASISTISWSDTLVSSENVGLSKSSSYYIAFVIESKIEYLRDAFSQFTFSDFLFGKVVSTNQLYTGGDVGFLTFYSSIGLLGCLVYILCLCFCLVKFRCSLPSYIAVSILVFSSMHYPVLSYPGSSLLLCFVFLVDCCQCSPPYLLSSRD